MIVYACPICRMQCLLQLCLGCTLCIVGPCVRLRAAVNPSLSCRACDGTAGTLLSYSEAEKVSSKHFQVLR